MRWGIIMDIFINRFPSVDLHGYDRDSARVRVMDFVTEALIMGEDGVVIVHGNGEGILKKEVHSFLKTDKRVKRFYVDAFNPGCTVVIFK